MTVHRETGVLDRLNSDLRCVTGRVEALHVACSWLFGRAKIRVHAVGAQHVGGLVSRNFVTAESDRFNLIQKRENRWAGYARKFEGSPYKFVTTLTGGRTSSDSSLVILILTKFRLSHHLSAFSRLVVHGAFASALLASQLPSQSERILVGQGLFSLRTAALLHNQEVKP